MSYIPLEPRYADGMQSRQNLVFKEQFTIKLMGENSGKRNRAVWTEFWYLQNKLVSSLHKIHCTYHMHKTLEDTDPFPPIL